MARAVSSKGCLAMQVRYVLGPVFADAPFEGLFPVRGWPAVSPARPALVSVFDGDWSAPPVVLQGVERFSSISAVAERNIGQLEAL